MRIIIFLLLSGCTVLCQSIGKPDSLKNLREKASKIKSHIKVVKDIKQGTAMFVPRSDILFPGLDEGKLEKIRKLWKEYYDCQKALYESSQRLIVPQALAFVEGSNVVLECEVCESPKDMFLDITWLYSAKYSMDDISNITSTPSINVRNDSLHINNIMDSRGGLYICQKGIHYARPYIIHVFNEEPSRMVVPVTNTEGDHPSPDVPVPELGLTVTTQWAEWTQCSRCGHIGKRYRRGICTVISTKHMTGSRKKRKTHVLMSKIVENHSNNQSDQGNGAIRNPLPISEYRKTSSKPERELHKNMKHTAVSSPAQYKLENSALDTSKNMSLKDDLAILDLFEEGIPCRSKLLSENIRKLGSVANRSSEVMVSYCKLACPQSILFMVVDEHGNILESANNSAGIYSTLQGLPMDFPSISRSVEFGFDGKPFIMHCPGYRFGDIPVEWYIGRKGLTNNILESETKGRIKIDEYNRIRFNPALLEDSRTFSCWQRRELVGTVRLIIERERDLQFDIPIMVIGTILTLGMFIYVFYLAFKNT